MSTVVSTAQVFSVFPLSASLPLLSLQPHRTYSPLKHLSLSICSLEDLALSLGYPEGWQGGGPWDALKVDRGRGPWDIFAHRLWQT